MPPREDVNAISVKIGTMPLDHLRLCKRRPLRGTFPATRGAPRVGEFFYVFGRFGVAIALRCTRINNGVYFADRAQAAESHKMTKKLEGRPRKGHLV